MNPDLNKFPSIEITDRFRPRLERLYPGRGRQCQERLRMMIGRYGVGLGPVPSPPYWNERDVVLITYGDSITSLFRSPLATLREFALHHLARAVSTIHILPFHPWSSDDGFAVKDYRKVDEALGNWEDVQALREHFDLMFDWVLNHVSSRSDWFRSFRNCILPYRNYFIVESPRTDLSQVVRPRTSPLLTPVLTKAGRKQVWTTFSEDQIDLDWRNPDVFFEMLDILFGYLSHGARIIRLDAVAFLWKKAGTGCLHLEETHEVVRLLRAILDLVSPGTLLLTETNVPHQENIGYLGEGNEAHMVYQFPLPPLLLHGLIREDARPLTRWARSLGRLPPGSTFLNFTASHDGIGMRPLEGILPEEEIRFLCQEMERRGARLSWRSRPDGSQSLYEINVTWYSALRGRSENPDLGEARFLCSQMVSLALKGIPALYIHSLLATPNDVQGAEESGMARRINRRKWKEGELEEVLEDPRSHHHRIFNRLVEILRRRNNCDVFHPDGDQEVIELDDRIFCLLRRAPRSDNELLCAFNFSREGIRVDLAPRIASNTPHELVSNSRWTRPAGPVLIEPFGVLWLLSTGSGED